MSLSRKECRTCSLCGTRWDGAAVISGGWPTSECLCWAAASGHAPAHASDANVIDMWYESGGDSLLIVDWPEVTIGCALPGRTRRSDARDAEHKPRSIPTCCPADRDRGPVHGHGQEIRTLPHLKRRCERQAGKLRQRFGVTIQS